VFGLLKLDLFVLSWPYLNRHYYSPIDDAERVLPVYPGEQWKHRKEVKQGILDNYMHTDGNKAYGNAILQQWKAAHGQ